MAEYIGFACAVVIGMVLGLTGAGGAILTVPVLVYIVGLDAVTATAYSLFIVGVTSAFGTFQNLLKNIVSVKTGLYFAAPSLIGVYLSRKYLVPALPEYVLTVGTVAISKDTFLLVLFATIMVLAGISMLRQQTPDEKIRKANKLFLAVKIFLAGLLVGLVGAGGGFLFVPILLFVGRLPIKNAAATSLLIITVNSLIGFLGDVQNMPINWIFVLTFTGFAIAGITAGIFLSRHVRDQRLKKVFGYFVLAMAAFIFARELVAVF